MPAIATSELSASERWWYALAMMDGERQRTPIACVAPKSSSFDMTERTATSSAAKSAAESGARAAASAGDARSAAMAAPPERSIIVTPLPASIVAIASVPMCS